MMQWILGWAATCFAVSDGGREIFSLNNNQVAGKAARNSMLWATMVLEE